MAYVINVELTDDLIRSVFRRRFCFGTGKSLLIIALTCGACAGLSAYFLEITWFTSACATVAGLCLWLMVMVFFTGPNAAIKPYQRMSDRSISYTFDDEGFAVVAELWEARYSWKVLRGVIRHRDVWFLQLADDRFFVLPADQINSDVRELFLEHIEGDWS
jgi:hypothetical protein